MMLIAKGKTRFRSAPPHEFPETKFKLIRSALCTAISAYERGLREPDLLVLLRYAKVARVSTDVLIDDTRNLP